MHDGVTFDDVLLIPQYSEVLPGEVCLETSLTSSLKMRIPFLSAAMDTVTESPMAAAMIQAGGSGAVHKNMPVEKQANEVRSLKAQGFQPVVAAIGAGEEGLVRAEKLIEAGVDALTVDTAHGHSKGVLDTIRALRKIYTKNDVQIIGGNIATGEAVQALAEAGADAVKVGIGPGSICTTRIVAGVGFPQLSALWECVPVAKKMGVSVIADGGLKSSGDCAKALAAGADVVMIGSLFAGTDEAPGETFEKDGRIYKSYRGMGSLGAMEAGSRDRYFQSKVESQKLVPEGVEACVEAKGSVHDVLHQLCGGVKSSMGYLGATNLENFVERARWVKMSSSGLSESRVHDVTIMKKSPNYQ
ncbi:MAG: IMP dehydrogenase [Oligoflexales bacterium]